MIAFLLSPFGKVISIIAILGLAYIGFRVWLAEHDKSVLSGYVLVAEKTAAEAKATEIERQRNAASQALSDATKRQQADELADQAAQAQTDLDIADYEKKLTAANRRCLADDTDIQFLRAH